MNFPHFHKAVPPLNWFHTVLSTLNSILPTRNSSHLSKIQRNFSGTQTQSCSLCIRHVSTPVGKPSTYFEVKCQFLGIIHTISNPSLRSVTRAVLQLGKFYKSSLSKAWNSEAHCPMSNFLRPHVERSNKFCVTRVE